MKEYSTKRLVRAVSVFLLVLIFGFIFMNKKELGFAITTQQTIDFLLEADYQILPEDVAYNVESKEPGFEYVDLRNPYEFNIGNIPGSVNIPQTELLTEKNLDFFKAAQNDSATVVLIGKDEATTTGPWLIMKQIGFDNLKVMRGGWDYYANQQLNRNEMSETPKYMVEQPAFNFAAIMQLMQSESGASQNSDAPEIVVPERKKKKAAVEGGC
ncbi:MAG: rhodanese-like domain-containing protein [Bacteroidales bacterium]|nr:rhodanese-like domain-containing protein [Bacteroidales bacterium]